MNADIIIIEKVVNGWIVRPHNSCGDRNTRDDVYVFSDIERLQSELPTLLGIKPVPVGPDL